MNYPRCIQPLVIEDEQPAKEYYEELFRQLGEKFAILPPKFAFCHADAKTLLSNDEVFHLIILDLRLPEEPGQPPAASLDLGLDLLEVCLRRDELPVPALLVISGNLKEVDQGQLETKVRNGFAYGRVLVKSDRLESAIEDAVVHWHRLCDVGIHIRDSENQTYPTILPRETELLRRCVVERECLGIDVCWWSVDYSPWAGWTKVLMGRFVLAGGTGKSIYTFFKMASDDGASSVMREAEIMTQKLSHVNVVYSGVAGDRSLLVTQAVGKGHRPPLSLDDVFQREPDSIGESVAAAATTIASQVAALGDHSPDQRPLTQLLWDHHDVDRLREQWSRREGPEIIRTLSANGNECPDPMLVFRHIQESEDVVRYQKQSCRHGDLNYTNVALEELPDGRIEAFIFDASGCTPGASLRDLAMLEVTTLIHQTPSDGNSILERLQSLFLPTGQSDGGSTDDANPQIINTQEFIRAIRSEAYGRDAEAIYMLLVFDNAIMQLSGLGFGSSYNKIHEPGDAALLVALSSYALLHAAPTWFEALEDPTASEVQG